MAILWLFLYIMLYSPQILPIYNATHNKQYNCTAKIKEFIMNYGL